ncbi:MAG TPA: hypothetical protein PLP82_13185 [Deltaproteobacteria bacterium]|nr:hypothetical protein [Deltaproteobacteria bacterium]HPE44831.1 hypothetical protein [Deltaproteobacteria bacterium]HPJ08530.1 hypothetical protein [Deltaproteobacteria bacterium]HPR04859.1 hypothetical protein [Deltaproteobacteria bacterium]
MTVPGGRQIEDGRTSIEPGKTQKVVVTVPTKYVRGRDPFTKSVEVETNDPDAAVIRLSVNLKVVDILRIDPQVVNFGTVRPRSVNTREVTITNKSNGPIMLSKVSAFPDTLLSISHNGNIMLEKGKATSITVSFKPLRKDDRFLGLLQFETNLEGLKVKTVQVRASVAGD